MAAPTSTAELLEFIRKSGVLPGDALDRFAASQADLPDDPNKLAALFVQKKLLTAFQAKLLLVGRYKGFRLGSYVLRDQLGQGGMGAVYLAEHETLRRKAAIKVLPPGGNKLAIERFLREARAAAALDHPNIVRTHDVGRDGDVHFLVMEYVEGQTLDRLVTAGGPLSSQRAVEYIAQAATGLQHAYEKGFIHRDIKPSNLILSKDGTVKILDMGLARSFEKNDQLTELLDQGAVVGTADYISPEQAMNDPKVDIRTDIYSLGATFFSLVTGRPPFDGPTASKLIQHQMKDAPSLTKLDKTIPRELAQVVARMMAKKADDRFQTPADVIVALHPWLHDTPPLLAGLAQTLEATTGKLSSKQLRIGAHRREAAARKKPNWLWAMAGGLAALVLLGIGVAVAVALSGNDKAEQTKATPTAASQPTTAPTTPKPPPSTGDGKSIYGFEAGSIEKFRAVLDSTAPVEGTVPKFPVGIGPISYKEGSRGQFAREEYRGRPGIAFTNLHENRELNSAQLGFQVEGEGGVELQPGKNYTITVEYATKGSGAGALNLQTMRYMNLASAQLGDTGGDWKTATLPVRRDANVPVRITVDTYAWGGDNALIFGKLTLREDKPAGTPEPKSSESIDKLSWTGAKPVKIRAAVDPANKNVKLQTPMGEGKYPAGWYLWPWHADTVSEAIIDESQGGWAIGIRNVSGPASTMIFAPEFKSETGFCRLRCEVLYAGKPYGANLKMIPNGQKSFDVLKIASQADWQSIDIVVDCRTTGKTKFEFHNSGDPDQLLWIRSYEIFPATKEDLKK